VNGAPKGTREELSGGALCDVVTGINTTSSSSSSGIIVAAAAAAGRQDDGASSQGAREEARVV
jgi:hypothetical protein